ncbi:MAG: hypothetical protein HUK14_02555 [Muribaculaceae bacterium]|nr:hypothetical protein [Muribaculaceae bacterium]
MKKYLLSILFASALFYPLTAQVQSPIVNNDDDEEEEELIEETDSLSEDDEQMRLNPVIDVELDADDIDIPVPAFINRGANRIQLNGADWSNLRRAFAASLKQPVSIVHIGDSHVQADINTGVTRGLLQYDFGNAGRGLIAPLKLSNTNQPSDYVFSSPDNWTPVKLMSRTWPYTMGFTGSSIHPSMQRSSIRIATSENEDYNPFSSITIFHGGKLTIDSVVNAQGYPIHFRTIPSTDFSHVILASQENDVRVYFTSTGDLTLYGVSLSADSPGLFYHAIGNNGATFATYNRIGNMGMGLRPLTPALVVISLGTNEAFGRLNPDQLYNSIDRLVKNIRAANPEAEILLVTPMECQKSVSKTVSKRVKAKASKRKKGKRRKGGGYRTVKSSVRSYEPNANIARVRDEILRYGKDNSIAVLDWYEVAGGRGASNTWIANNLFSKDRVHHSAKGYRLQGRLLYDAILEAIVNK